MRVKLLSLFLLSGLIFASCGSDEPAQEELVAKGGKLYGGEFKFMSTEKINALYPAYAADIYSMRLVSQIYEPLLKLNDETGMATPAVAESFEVSKDAKVYTFKIRKGIKFHEDDCFNGEAREVNAKDVKFTFEVACSQLKENQVSYLLKDRIKGGNDYYNASKSSLPSSGISGVKVIDDYTIQITLEKPFVGFEKVLTHPSLGITCKEVFEKYGADIKKHAVGSGPFALEQFDENKVVLKRNPNYWRKDEFGNQLPFLSKVVMTYADNKRSELMSFRAGNIDLVLELPVEEIEHILGTLQEAQDGKNILHKVDSEKSMSMMFIAFANQSDEFKDERVREAFNLAVDRDQIIEIDLEGEGWAAKNGFVPDLPDYPNEEVKGHDYDVEKAKALMREAGYPGGANFPELDFYVATLKGSGVHKACQSIEKQLEENLGVKLNIVLCSIEDRQEAIQSGKAKIWREGWIADYPDAENFLGMFYSKNISDEATMVNTFKYSSPAYDAIYEKALVESDDDKRHAYFVELDQMIVDDAAVMPILTDDHIVMINARVRDFEASPIESLDLTNVFIKEIRK